MVRYNPKDWFGLIFKFHKQETFRKLAWVMLSIAVYTAIVVYIEIEILQLKYASTTIVHSLLGFIISLLLVFRTNTAYDRWWEGRKQWGALVNVSRNLALKIDAILPAAER
jgi:putative membrane protein